MMLALFAGYLAGRADMLLSGDKFTRQAVRMIRTGFTLPGIMQLERDIQADCREAQVPEIRLAHVFWCVEAEEASESIKSVE